LKKYLIIFSDADFPNNIIQAESAELAAKKAIENAGILMKTVNTTLYLPGGLSVYDAKQYETVNKPEVLYRINKMITIN
jgi:hypothetical protein